MSLSSISDEPTEPLDDPDDDGSVAGKAGLLFVAIFAVGVAVAVIGPPVLAANLALPLLVIVFVGASVASFFYYTSSQEWGRVRRTPKSEAELLDEFE